MGGRNRTPSNHERPLDRLIARPHLVPSSDAKCCRHCRRTLPDSETITPCTHTRTHAKHSGTQDTLFLCCKAAVLSDSELQIYGVDYRQTQLWPMTPRRRRNSQLP
jgi:hypothetical protein